MLASLRSRVKKAQFSRVEVSLFLILLVFGGCMILLIPPGAGYDEEDHLVRVWELSTFSLVPGQLSPQELRYPTIFRDVMYRQQGSAGVIDSDFWQDYARIRLSERGFVRRELDTKSVYSPALLLPQSIAMRVFGRLADLPVLQVFYLSRLAGLLSYLILTWAAIRLIPFGKWILLVLAASPMALFQAATLSPDAISNGIGFLFVAGCLHMAKTQEIGWRDVGHLVFFIFLLFLAKLNILPLLLLLFLLIPPANFPQKRLYVFMLAMTLILFLVEVAGWNWVASTNFNSLLSEEANPRAQTIYILAYPLTFVFTAIKDALSNGLFYVQSWVNGYGYYYWTPPQLVLFFYLVSLAVAIFGDSTSQGMNKKFRINLILVFVAGYLTTIASLYLSFAPVGSQEVFGVQGRYFIPLTLPLFLVLASVPWRRIVPVLSSPWVLTGLISALSLNLLGLFFSFHVPCGSTFYQTGLCYRPLFRDFSGEVRASPPVSGDMVLSQEFEVTCNGLTEVRVLVAPSVTEDHGITRFLLLDAASQQPLLDLSIANGPIRTEDWYPLHIQPDWHSAGKQYMLEILGTSPFPEEGLQFFYTPQPEFNRGDFYESGQLLEEDLVLQYGCVTGLRKLWLAGRP